MSESSPCRIFEIVQYSCQPHRKEVQCFPIPRIFRICPGSPAVEITKLVTLDESTGEVKLPSGSHEIPVQGKPWRDVIRYAKLGDEDDARSILPPNSK